MGNSSDCNSLFNNDIVSALLGNIYDLYLYDVATKKVSMLKSKGQVIGVSDGISMDASYETLMNIYIDNNVIESDREPMRQVVKIDSILNRLRDQERFIYHYRVFRDSKERYFYMKVTRLGDEEITGVLFSFTPENNDINRERLIDIIEVDELTGVYTRQAFCHYAEALLNDDLEGQYNVVAVDVSNFRMINAVFGEGKADEVLIHIANTIRRVSSHAVIGRYSADCFIGIGKDFGALGNVEHIEYLLDEMVNSAPISNLSVKLGAYMHVDRSLSIVAMCDRALMAVRSIKNSYDASYTTYDGPVSRAHLKAQEFEADFERALENKEFVVWYQPKYDSHHENIVGVEALVRWKKEDGSIISPGEFIPVFEKDGKIVKLDEYVFERACKDKKYVMDRGYKTVPVSVNLSRASLYAKGVKDRYKKILKETGISVGEISLEITESADINNVKIIELMNELRAEGFNVELDDFGTGVSSLSSINKFPFNSIKLDKSLIDDIGDPGADELLRHTIELAHFKNMLVVAEGVEHKKQFDTLKKLGSDQIQGYYFSSPKPFEKMCEIMYGDPEI